jgi:hypothetical protein
MHFVCSFYKKKITVILIFNYYELLFLDIFFRIYFRPLFWRALMYFTKVIIFYLVRFLLKKIIKSILKKKTEIEPVPVQTDWFQFSYFRTKTGSYRFGSVFSDLAPFFFVFVLFGFFSFKLIKPNWSVFF